MNFNIKYEQAYAMLVANFDQEILSLRCVIQEIAEVNLFFNDRVSENFGQHRSWHIC